MFAAIAGAVLAVGSLVEAITRVVDALDED